ncbi:uncharacterized protein [Blastocystis hominis]|uniref:Peptidase C1A papain C-terminal domain-containing protein n=1 Tax=Blastocystis hominis TaxID=12968 RepID=D8M9V7_BLAHO|nr:uncharacterized protein [Blastocystis hominis]CBK24846.2 unnamed protein product [Blastocystis hominis]|eukprot:XP_012898894.1 uncharacterized protein [Blastocystis hominis]
MKSIIFVLFAVALSVSLRDDFSAFEARYGKNYLPAERAFRAKVFEYNMEWARKMNAQNHPYTVGMTPFADMTNTEFANSKLCGCMLKPKMTKPATPIMQRADETVDWREKGAVTPVKNQASCGSCWAFSATGAMEGRNFVANGELISLSEQQLVDCDHQSSGCGGGWMTYAFEYAMKKGMCKEEDYPYHAVDEDCKDDKCTPVVFPKGYEEVPMYDGAALKQAVSQGPVSVAVEADSIVFQMYTGGVIDSTACGTSLNHGVLAVGYGADYWIVKNSWDQVHRVWSWYLRYQPDELLPHFLNVLNA